LEIVPDAFSVKADGGVAPLEMPLVLSDVIC
jgi:hypothetical protein